MVLNNWGGMNHEVIYFHEFVNLFNGKSGSGTSGTAFFVSAFRFDLRSAFGTGDNDLPLPNRHPADGAALAGEVLVLLIRPAGLGPGGVVPGLPDPAHKLLVLRPALGQVFGEHSEQNKHHQHPKEGFADPGGDP